MRDLAALSAPRCAGDVTKSTHSNLGVLQVCRIDDHWNVDVDRFFVTVWSECIMGSENPFDFGIDPV